MGWSWGGYKIIDIDIINDAACLPHGRNPQAVVPPEILELAEEAR